MNKAFKMVYSACRLFGFDPVVFVNSLKGLGFYFRDLSALKKQRGDDTSFPMGKFYPVLDERHSEAGSISGHYFHQDLYVARKLFHDNPVRHIDIGSRIDGFVAHVASYREIEVFDIREQKGKVKNIVFRQADLMQLPENLIDASDSISSLHVIEHFGLGRYGDPVDYFGHKKAIENITKILKKNGKFYFSTPIGPQRIEFNAQRVFSLAYLLKLFEEDYKLLSFSYIDDVGNFHEEVKLSTVNISNNFGCHFGCGIFELIKIDGQLNKTN